MSIQAALDVLSFPVDSLSDKMHEFFKGPGVLLSLRRFVAAVDWADPLVVSILAGHALLLTLTVVTRSKQGAQLAILALCFSLVRGGEALNGLASRKWDDVFVSTETGPPSSSPSRRTRQNYFDEGGIFWSALVSAPLLMIMAVQLFLYLRSAWHLMIELKVAQLRASMAVSGERRQGKEEEKMRSSGKSKKTS